MVAVEAKRSYLIALLILIFTIPTLAADKLRVATWNIEWLGDGVNDMKPRTATNIQKLQSYVDKLDADIVALQEIENEAAAYSIFNKNKWEVYMSNRNAKQRTGFAVRRDMPTEKIEKSDYTDLYTSQGMRYGIDIELLYPNGKIIRLLAIHLKSGCFDEPDLSEDSNQGRKGDSCMKLGQQIEPLREWVDARLEENLPFAIMGDWNRRLNKDNDAFWNELTDGLEKKLHRAGGTDRKSTCWNSQYPNPIDHIILGGGLEEVPKSFIETTYNKADEKHEDVLSDHCPISLEVKLPPSPTTEN